MNKLERIILWILALCAVTYGAFYLYHHIPHQVHTEKVLMVTNSYDGAIVDHCTDTGMATTTFDSGWMTVDKHGNWVNMSSTVDIYACIQHQTETVYW